MSWPGAPKSASSPPINQPSTRFPFTLSENSSMGDVADAMRTAFNGLAVHEQAFANLPDQITTKATSAATTAIENFESIGVAGVSTFNTLAGAILFFPGLGDLNSQLGQASYTAQQSDAGAKIVVGDSSAVTLNFGAGLLAPWFCVVDNDSSSVASLVATAGTMFGAQHIYPGGFGIVFYDGANFWAGATPLVPTGITATIATAKLTVGGANGSMTFSAGLLTASTPAT